MKRYLIITEKPSLQRAIKEIYEKNKDSLDYVADFVHVICPVSHISDKILKVDLTISNWQKLTLKNTVVPEGYYIYKPEHQTNQLNDIINLIANNNYDLVINAYDVGMYGQLSYEFVKENVGFTVPDKRLWYSDLTEYTILKAFQNFKDNNEILSELLKEFKEDNVR